MACGAILGAGNVCVCNDRDICNGANTVSITYMVGYRDSLNSKLLFNFNCRLFFYCLQLLLHSCNDLMDLFHVIICMK